ncbi:MAG: hypothetical protein ACRDKJ_11605 [Actinomycetota bacterium]
MFPTLLSQDLLDRIAAWPQLKRWERREIGQELRRIGLSYREIGALIPAHKGTLSGWCRDIHLTEEQLARLAFRPSRFKAARERGLSRRRSAIAEAGAIRSHARERVSQLRNDPFWVAGAVAYWAEGDKRSKEVRFSNSDPNMIRLFLAWACRYLGVAQDRFTIILHLHAGQTEAERRSFWSTQTGLPLEQFRKTFIKPEGTGHRKNKLYNGTAQIRIRRGTALNYQVLGWLEGLGTAFVFSG